MYLALVNTANQQSSSPSGPVRLLCSHQPIGGHRAGWILYTMKTHCSDCNQPFPILPAGHVGGTGYAILPNSRRICYACADQRQIAELKDRTKPFVGYLSANKVTTWTGGQLMTVTRSRPCKLTRPSWTHDAGSYRSIRAVDVHGGQWIGRGSDGIAIKLQPVA